MVPDREQEQSAANASSLTAVRSQSLDLLRTEASFTFRPQESVHGRRVSQPRLPVQHNRADSASNPHIHVRHPSQPQTPSRERQDDITHQLRSKFSMSPDHRSKRAKTRFQDFSIITAQDEGNSGRLAPAKSTFSSWSLNWGSAARKANRLATARTSEESSSRSNSECSALDQSAPPLKHAGSLASIRRLITPSKAKRKESSDSGQESSAQYLPPIPAIPPRCASHGSYQDSLGIVTELLARQPRVDGPLQDAATSTTEHTQADHRCSAFKVYSRMHETQTGTHAKGEAQPSKSKSLDLVREVDRAGGNIARASLHLLGSSSPEFRDVRESTPVVKRRRTEGEEGCAEPAVSVPTDIKPEPSRFKTLQLLVRRPFGGISKKKTEWRDGRSTVLNSNRSWWQSRFAQHAPRHNGESALSSERPQDCHPAPRHSDDLLTRASSQVPSDVLAPKSKSVDLDRFHAQSRTVPIWPAGSRVRPALPPAFVTEPTAAHNDVVSARADSHGDAAISEQKHPWLRQLKLQAVASSAEPSLSAKVSAATTPKSASSRRTSSRKSVVMGRRSSPRPEARRSVKKQRPPSVLLGQSLPIPPRSHRSRASTISSQNSIISSPQGKVIVSRRCYGPRSPMRHDETCSITTVGTSILFGDSTDVPSLAFPLATSPAKISPRVKKGRLPLRTEAIQRRNAGLCDGRSPRFGDLESRLNDGDAQEWVDEVDEAPTVTSIELAAFTKRFEDSLSPKARPGFLEMSDVTDSLNQLIGSFDESAGSVSLYSSPRKPKKSAYGHAICGALTPSQRVKRGPLGATPRRVCCSIVSTVSTEANSSFEDSEELQKLIESMMSADVSGSTSDHSMSKGDLALLSPFGSPLDTRDQSTTTSEDPPSAAGSATKLPPPRFLLNDRPISPPEIFSEFQHSLDNDLPNFLSGTSVVSPPTERYGL